MWSHVVDRLLVQPVEVIDEPPQLVKVTRERECENLSLAQDIRFVLTTLPAVFRWRGAY
jgi:hypothetical protein